MAQKRKIPDAQGKSKDYEVGYKKPPTHSRWKPGQSGNPKGRPRQFDELRTMILDLFSETAEVKNNQGKKVGEITRLEAMLRRWMGSEDYQKQAKALEYGFGKVPEDIRHHTFDIERFIKENISLFTDGQLQRLNKGESGEAILSELLAEAMNLKRKNK